MAAIDIVWITARVASGFAWFADSLALQATGGDFDVIVIDGLYGPEREARFKRIVDGRFACRYYPPLPSPFRGRHRLTKHEYHAPGANRNAGVVYATAPYVVFVDDAGVLMNGWWAAVSEAARSGIVVSGSYAKQWCMVVERGVLLAGKNGTIDGRWPQGRDNGPVRIEGAQLYSSSMGAPRELMLLVNGFDALCDGVGAEDFQLGIRLERAGVPIHYHRGMLTVESEELHRVGVPRNVYNPELDQDLYMRRLANFSVAKRAGTEKFDASAMIVDLAYGAPSLEALGNYYSLRELNAQTMNEIIERMPTHHWFDDRPLSALSPTPKCY